MLVYVPKLYSYEYAHEYNSQPKILGVYRNIESAKKAIYRKLVLDHNLFIIVWARYQLSSEYEFSIQYPEIWSIPNFSERINRHILRTDQDGDPIFDTIDLNREFVEDLIDLSNMESIVENNGYYRYEIVPFELV